MGFELGRLVREAAGELGTRVAEKARDLRRRAEARAGRVWRDVGGRLRLQVSVEVGDGRPGETQALDSNAAVGPRTRALVELMAETLPLAGYCGVRADVAGRAAPEVVRGTLRSHRPSLAALGGGRPVLFDVYVPDELDPGDHLSRWHLFASAADQCGGEFHVVVPSWLHGAAGRDWVRQLADGTGVRVAKVWEV